MIEFSEMINIFNFFIALTFHLLNRQFNHFFCIKIFLQCAAKLKSFLNISLNVFPVIFIEIFIRLIQDQAHNYFAEYEISCQDA